MKLVPPPAPDRGPAGVVTLHFSVVEAAGEAAWGYVIRGAGGVEAAAHGAAAAGGWSGLERALRSLAPRPPADLVIRTDCQAAIRRLAAAVADSDGPLDRDRPRALLAGAGWRWRAEWVPREENPEALTLAVRAWERAAGRPFPRWDRYLAPKPRPDA